MSSGTPLQPGSPAELTCSRCQKTCKDRRGLAAHQRFLHPNLVADKPSTAHLNVNRAQDHEDKMREAEAAISREIASRLPSSAQLASHASNPPPPPPEPPEGASAPNPFNIQKKSLLQDRVARWRQCNLGPNNTLLRPPQ